ncbi:MAG: carbon-nitrogen hydrolase family protein [Saprospiraceae bacterium]|nr:carbon-nitrogen hydrolase family protein [Saprospiraceae bacterium]
MRLCVAQIRPVSGSIAQNIGIHKKWIDRAIQHSTDIIIFPELSITGYEPNLAHDLALHPDDARLEVFQHLSDQSKIIIGVGAPIRQDQGITISLILFHPNASRQVNSKKYIHKDEEPFFIPGHNESALLNHHPTIALSICYELSVPQHAEDAHRHGANIYLSSVAKTAQGILRANARLSEIAQKYKMTVLMSNCVGVCDQVMTTGNSAVWDDQGIMLAQLDQSTEGLLIWDTKLQETICLVD